LKAHQSTLIKYGIPLRGKKIYVKIVVNDCSLGLSKSSDRLCVGSVAKPISNILGMYSIFSQHPMKTL
jgi:hypothetical protein